jgi:hypothetical protein
MRRNSGGGVYMPIQRPLINSFSPDSNIFGDGITNVNLLTLTGTAVANSTVSVYDGATLLGSATANASGTWSFATAALMNGTHSFTATDTVSGTTSAASAALNVTVDTTAPLAPTISSFSPDSGTVGDQITNAESVTLIGAAEAASTVSVFDGATLLGTATADASGVWNFTSGNLYDGTHILTATDTDAAGNTSQASLHFNVTVVPSITSFSTTPFADFYIGANQFEVDDAGRSWSMSSPDDHTLRFEVRAGDRPSFDTTLVERSMASENAITPQDTTINVSYQFLLEPGATNTAAWLVTAQLHNDDRALGYATSPPFAVEMNGERMQIGIRYLNADGSITHTYLYADTNNIQRGQYYDMQIQVRFDNTGNGFLIVWRDGIEIVNYHGPLGYGTGTYWTEGIYRADAPETIAADYQNLVITTGSTPPAITSD